MISVKVILILYFLITIIQFVFLHYVFRPLGRCKNKDFGPKSLDFLPISILIVVKNEQSNLNQLLPLLLAQKYPGSWDIHIVDDHSEDGSVEEVLAQMPLNPNLCLHQLTGTSLAGKKQSLAYGLSKTNFDLVLFTDADCRPASNHWLHLMQAGTASNEIVLGYSPYRQEPTWLNDTIRLETNFTALLYLGLAVQGHGYMGVGRNILYKKSLVLAGNILEKHNNLLSGDDDLTINELGCNHSIAIQLDPESFVESIPKKTWKAWLHQKSRHVSTGKYYQRKHIVILLFFYSSLILSWCIPTLLMLKFPLVVVLFFLIKLVYYFILNKLFINVLKNNFTFIGWMRAECSYVMTLLYLIPASLIKKPSHW